MAVLVGKHINTVVIDWYKINIELIPRVGLVWFNNRQLSQL